MQLQKLQAYLSQYADWLGTPEATERLSYWETLANWQTHWDTSAPDFAAMYKRALNNQTNRRAWVREAYEPKRMMLVFAEMDPHFVHSMFADLFNEEKDVLGRAERFVFYCEQLLLSYREQFPKRRDNSHYHDDGYGIISLYLSLQYPTEYAPYQADRLRKVLERLGAPNIPLAGDFPRHVKLMKTLRSFLLKDEAIVAAHQARLRPVDYQDNSLLLSFDFCCFIEKAPPLASPA